MTNDPRTPETEKALRIARQLIDAGIPVFAAAPCPEDCPIQGHRGGPGKYHLPKHWEKTVPTPVWLDRWRPGWALAAVGGHVCDFLDIDPRSGGHASLEELKLTGHMPRVFSEVATPSGGRHFMINATGERKLSGFLPGIDLQSGNGQGGGRGLVWIPPTVRPSKDPNDTGTLRPYRWIGPPDLEALREWIGTEDPSLEGIVSRVRGSRAIKETRVSAPATDPDDPFMTSSMTYHTDRSFTMAEAKDFCRSSLVNLREAKIGMIEEAANAAAATLSHFVPAFWSVDQAMALLEQAASHTKYDPEGPSDWTLDKFRKVLDGSRPVQDPWKATLKPDPPAPPEPVVVPEPGEEGLNTLERLRRKLMSASELADLPVPEPLIDGLLNLNTESWIIGAPGSLKSFIALDFAAAVGAGRPWQGRRVRKAKVLYVLAEGAPGAVLRVRAHEKAFGPMEGVTFLPYPVQVSSSDGQWPALVTLAGEAGYGFIVIDTQARVTVGLEENSAKDMGILTNAVGMLKRATGACVLVVHHTGRNGGDARGSSALDGAQDTELKVIRSKDRAALECKLIQDKQKDMAEGDEDGIRLQFKVVDLGRDPVTDRDLSSLVIGDLDAFRDAEAQAGRDPRQPWLPHFSQLDVWRRRLLNTLYVFAPDRGMTKPELDRVMREYWSDYNPNSGGPKRAWKDLLSLTDPSGEYVVGTVGGERYGVLSLPVRDALRDELQVPGGQGEVPGLTRPETGMA